MTIDNNRLLWKHSLIRLSLAVTALVISAFLFACSQSDHKSAGPTEKIIIAYAALPEAALAQIAQSRGFYREVGLETTAHVRTYGKLALKEVLEGKADIATVAETPVMFAIMNGEKISVIATIQSSKKNHAIIARKDKGILKPQDLKGKKIATTFGITADFYLDTFFASHSISRKDMTIVNLKPEEYQDAIVKGEIDAVSIFYPFLRQTLKILGSNGITFYDDELYTETFHVVATQDFVHKNPGKVRKLLHALVKAEGYAKSNQADSQKIVSDFIGTEIDIVRDIWDDNVFEVKLYQTLIFSLEDESQWAKKRGLTKATKIPNYLDFIYFDGLMSVKPEAVRILK
jgi:sulfonate transport system substrate-binding protein